MDSYRSVHGKRRNGKIILISFINNYGFFIKKKEEEERNEIKEEYQCMLFQFILLCQCLYI